MNRQNKMIEEMKVNDFVRLYPDFWYEFCREADKDLIKDLLTDPLYIVRVTTFPEEPELNLAEIGYMEDAWYTKSE